MRKVGRAEADRIVRSNGWLAQQPADFQDKLLRCASLKHFAPGEAVFNLGDPAGGIYGLVTGTVSVNIAPAGSTPRTIHVGAPGHWTGEACFLTRKPRRGELHALVKTSMLHVPLGALDRMAARDPNVVHYVALILMMNVETLLRVIHDLQKPQAARRIASVLERATWIGEVPIPLTQTELGIIANASRKQVNAALRRFSRAGWLEHAYRSVLITDAKALRDFAAEDQAD